MGRVCLHRFLCPLLLLLLAGCAINPRAGNSVCAPLWQDFVSRTDYQQAIEGSALAGYPELISNRFLASFDITKLTPRQFKQWRDMVALQGKQDRALAAQQLGISSPLALERCLAEALPGISAEQLSALNTVDDDYLSWPSYIGLLALTKPIVNYLAADLRKATNASFGQPLSGSLRHYQPQQQKQLTDQQLSDLFNHGGLDNALQIPLLEPSAMTRLAQHYAPSWLLQESGEFDHIGEPVFLNGNVSVDTQLSSSYFKPSFTRIHNVNYLQLNYFVWFSQRPKDSVLDLYGGVLDGLIWRLTLDHSGKIMIADSVHSCGCYHKVYPVAQLQFKGFAKHEEPFVLIKHNRLNANRPALLSISSAEHFLVAINQPLGSVPKQLYQRLDYSQLYLISDKQRKTKRSLFETNGLVPGSERLERFLLWNTGIRSPGAMRQWGRHAVAFTSRRHFDDARLWQNYFVIGKQ